MIKINQFSINQLHIEYITNVHELYRTTPEEGVTPTYAFEIGLSSGKKLSFNFKVEDEANFVHGQSIRLVSI